MIPDYHMHTTLCGHATGTTVEYVETAARLGIREIGFTDHSPMRQPFDDWRMAWEDFPRYLEMVETARKRGTELGVTVRLGLECDYLPGHEDWLKELSAAAEFDYLIGSVHYLDDDLVVDHPEHLSRLQEQPAAEVWTRYWNLYARAIRTELFDIMAHPDLPKKFGHVPEGDLRPYFQESIDTLSRAGSCIEINTAGLRKPIAEMYPSAAFLTSAHEAGIPLTIGSDAHAPDEVGADFDRALDLARRCGYTEVLTFEKRRPQPLTLPTS
ncbi:MAG: histidinol-phosphatase HisJ family protein [Verrucomicrobiota bacterium]